MITTLTSLKNDLVKRAASLKMKKYRQKEGLFLLEGKRAVEEALASGWTIRALFFTRLPEGWEQQAENSSLPWYEVPLPVLQKITATEDPQSVAALVELRREELAAFAPERGMVLVLDRIRDPGNLGTLIRTADALGAAGVVLPYDDGRLGFLAMLPDGELDAWLETLDGDTLPALLAAAEEERVLLRLPKFEAEWGGELSDALAAMGLETAFDPDRADFSALGTAPDGPLYVSSVVHKARIEVNEKGTEAAAATVVGVDGAAAPTDYRELVLDRPFCYAVVDLERGVPLFLGTFERP